MSLEARYPSEMLFAETQLIAYPEGVVRVPTLMAHPSYRAVNIKLRTFGGLRGDDAELALLRDALDYIGGAQVLAA